MISCELLFKCQTMYVSLALTPKIFYNGNKFASESISFMKYQNSIALFLIPNVCSKSLHT